MDSVVFTGRKRAVMSESEMIGARKESAFKPKHHFSPSLAKACPASAGPDHDRHVELDRIQRDGVRHVV